jgi:hypothetical protein
VEAQDDMENLISLKIKFKQILSKDENEKIRLDIEKLKHKFFRINRTGC